MAITPQRPIVATVGKIFAKIFQLDAVSPEKSTDTTAARPGDEMMGRLYAAYRALSGGASATAGDESRVQRYGKYKALDRNLAEAAAALNVYADNIVSGTIGGEENYSVTIDETEPNIEALEEIVTEAEKRCKIKDLIWDLARDMVRDGDVFLEPVIVQVPDSGKYMIDRLKTLPVAEVMADVNEYGSFKDEQFPYYQKPSGQTEIIKFEWWRCIHFKTGNAVYGYEKSLFANAALRIGKQMIWIDEALVIARLTRAWKRFAYMIDTKSLGPDEAMSYVERFLQRIKSKTVITDTTRGRTELMDAPPLPDEDVGIPVGENTKADVRELSGDMNVANIADVEYLQRKFLMAVTVPKAYVSLEEGVNARATMGYIDVQFARQVRRRQGSLKPALRKIYEMIFTLAGVDHRSFKWEVEFPELATSDEMQKWQMMQIKVAIAQTLLQGLGVVNQDYVLKELLEFDDEMIKKYAAIYQEPQQPEIGPDGQPVAPADNVQLPPELAMMVRRDPQVRAILDDLKDLVSYKMSRVERMKGMRAVGVNTAPVRSLKE